MNANRMKYTTTPTYGMQKRGFFKRPEPAYKAPDEPDFAQTADPAEIPQPFIPQGGFAQPFQPAPGGFSQPPFYPQGQGVQPMQPNGFTPPAGYAMQGYPVSPMQKPYNAPQQSYMPPLGNSAPPLNPMGNGFSTHAQGYIPPATQQRPAQIPAVQNAAFMGTQPFPAMGGVPLPTQPMQGYQPNTPPQMNPLFAQAPNPASNQPVFNYRSPTTPPKPAIPMDADKLWTVFLFGILPLLFIPCLFVPDSLDVLRYLFLTFCVAGLGAMWYRQMFTPTLRMVVSVVYVTLCIVTIALMMQGGRDTQQNAAPVNAQSQPQVQASPTPDPALAGVVSTEAPVAPAPSPSGPSEAEQRLTTFMNLWMGMNTPEMVSFVRPSWASTQDNPSSQLFTVLANRTPEAFTIEDISGTDDDNSRTVTMTATINKNNGKDPTVYRFMVVMVKESGEWYVDPNSLATNDEVAPSDENVVNQAETSGLMTMAPRTTVTPVPPGDTKLYYNPDGGHYFHADPNCPSIRPEYLPLKGSFLYSELKSYMNDGLQPCLKCGAPTQAMEDADDSL